jgi:Zn-dependent protease/CBS domain-containing protein
MTSWNLRLGRYFGIPIEIHWTFWLLLAYVFFGSLGDDGSTSEAFFTVAFVLAIFTCVVLHELGHALAARRYGVKTRDITLYPIGGVARLERIPERPMEELIVAIAGPLVNVVIAGALYLGGVRLPSNLEQPSALTTGDFLSRLLMVNCVLVFFNLLPAFPMDGGRIFRAFLALFMDYVRATRIASSMGQFMAILFGFLGLSGYPMLLFIALFVWLGATGEAGSVEQRFLLKDASVRDAMLVQFAKVRDDDTLGDVVKRLLSGSQSEFPVYDSRTDRSMGLLTRNILINALATHGAEGLVRDCPIEPLGTADVRRSLLAAVQDMREKSQSSLEVLDDRGEVVGLLTHENLAEFIMVRSALRGNG